MEKSYIKWDMYGFTLEGMNIVKNEVFEVEHKLVKTMIIEIINSNGNRSNQVLKSITFELKNDVMVEENIPVLGDYLEEICINLFMQDNVTLNNPKCSLSTWFDKKESRGLFTDQIKVSDFLIFQCESKDFYKKITSKKTNISNAKKVYRELFRIADYVDEVLRFMLLYEFMKCSINAKNQQDVIKYLKKYYVEKQWKITFLDSRKQFEGKPLKKEDIFTYLRNKIGHSDTLSEKDRREIPAKISGILPFFIEVINDILIIENVTDEKISPNGIEKYIDLMDEFLKNDKKD